MRKIVKWLLREDPRLRIDTPKREFPFFKARRRSREKGEGQEMEGTRKRRWGD